MLAQTPAGTTIPNRVEVSYASANGDPQSAFSNTVVVQTGVAGGLVLMPSHTRSARPGERLVFRHTLTNTQNTGDAFRISATSAGGWSVVVYRDANGNGQLDPEDPLWNGAVAVDAGASEVLFAVVSVPDGRAIRGQRDLVTLVGVSEAKDSLRATVLDTIQVLEAGVTVQLTKVVDRSTATTGDTLTYTIAYAVTGSEAAGQLEIRDAVPAGTMFVPGSLALNGAAVTDAADDDAGWFDAATASVALRLGDVPPGSTGAVRFLASVRTAVAETLRNVARGEYRTPVGVDTAVSDTAQTAVAFAALTLTKEVATSGPVQVGDPLAYVIRYANTSRAIEGRDLRLTDTLPPGLSFWSATPTPQVNGNVLSWPLGTLAPGARGEVQLVVRVTHAGSDSMNLVNRVALTALNAAASRAAAQGVVVTSQGNAAMHLTKTANVLEVGLGEVAPFTLAVENTGSTPLRDVVIVDRPPSGLHLVPGSVVGADSATVQGDELRFYLRGPITEGATAVIRYQLSVVSAGTPMVQNRAVATAEGGLVSSGEALAWVRVRAASPMETRAVIGKVWADLNADGVQNTDEPGVEGVDVWTVDGEIATTDQDGRFSFRNLQPGRHAFRLDAGSLPVEYGLVDEPLADLEIRDASGWTTPRVVFRVVPRSARLVGVRLPVTWTVLARPIPGDRHTVRVPLCDVPPHAAVTHTAGPVALPVVEFGFDGALLTAATRANLRAAADALAREASTRVEVAGYTDAMGSEAYNLRLSSARAETVRGYLVEQGIPDGRLEPQGYGEAHPVASNATRGGRARNRRVELRPLPGTVETRASLGGCSEATAEYSVVPAVVTEIDIANPYAESLRGLSLVLAPSPDSTQVVVDGAALRHQASASLSVPAIPAGHTAHVLAWSAPGTDSVTATLAGPASAETLQAEVHNPLRPASGVGTLHVRSDSLPGATSIPAGGVVEVQLAVPAGRHGIVYVVPAGWEAVPGSLRDADHRRVDVTASRGPRGATVLAWRMSGSSNGPLSLALRPVDTGPVEAVTVPALRSEEERSAERRRALVAGPGVELFAPADGTVLATDRLFVGVRGEPGAPVALFDGDSLLADGTVRSDGVHDFIGIRLFPGPHRLRVQMRNSWSNERWDSLAVHVVGKPAAFLSGGTPTHLAADGQSQETIRVRVVDAWGVPVTQGPLVTVTVVGGVVASPDADRSSVGHQVRPDAAGTLQLVVRAAHEVRHGAVHLSAGEAHTTLPLEILPVLRPLMLTAVGRAGLGADPQAFGAVTARGRLDARTSVVLSYDTRALSADRDAFGRVADPFEEAQYPLLGDAGQHRSVTASRQRFAARVERNFDWLEFGDVLTQNFAHERTLARYGRTLTGVAGRLATGAVTWHGFASSTTRRMRQIQLRGAGIAGPYVVGGDVLPGTDVVALETRAYDNAERVVARESLVRFVDYQLDDQGGTLLFKQPIPSADVYGNPIFIMVTYETAGGGDAAAVWGLRAATDAGRLLDRRVGFDSLVIGGTWVADGSASAGAFRLAGGDVRLRRGSLSLAAELAHANSPDSSGLAAAVAASFAVGRAVQLTGRWTQVGAGFHNPSAMHLRAQTSEAALGVRALVASNELRLDYNRQRFGVEDVTRSQTRGSVARTLVPGLRLTAGVTADRYASGGAATSTQAGELELAWQATPRLRLWTEGRQLRSADGPVALPAHVGVGARMQIASGLALEARHRLVMTGDSGGYTVTNVGLRTRLGSATEAWSSYQLAGVDGVHGAAVVGLNSRARVNRHWTVSGALERRFGLGRSSAGEPTRGLPFLQDEEDYWAISVGSEWLPSDRPYRGSARAELREGSLRSTRLLAAAGAVSLGPTLALLSRHELLHNTMTLPSGDRDSRRLWSLWGLAVRPTRSDRLNVLSKVEWLDVQNPQGGGVLTNQGHEGRLIIAGEAVYERSANSELAARYALRRTRATLLHDDGQSQVVTALAHFVGARAQVDVVRGLGARADGRMLYDAKTATVRYDVAPQLVFVPGAGVEVAAGYRLGSLRDPDFATNGGPGFFLTLGAHITERSLANAADFWLRRLGRQR